MSSTILETESSVREQAGTQLEDVELLVVVTGVKSSSGFEQNITVGVSEAEAASQAGSESAAKETKAKAKPSQGRDIRNVLEMMQSGVLVELHITLPPFTARMTPRDLGMELSAEEQKLMENFQLGAIKLLPREYLRLIDAAESSARKCLYHRSFGFGRARFVPANLYEEWQSKNQEYLEKFNRVAAEIIEKYTELVEKLLVAYQAVAERNWQDIYKRKVADMVATKRAAKNERGQVLMRPNDFAGLMAEKEQFLENYMAHIRQCVRPVEAIRHRFTYTVELSRIALPTELERDRAEADDIRRQNQKREAELRTHLAELKAQQAKLQAEVWAERQVQESIAQVRLQAAREKARLELEQEKRRTEVAISRIEQQRKIEAAVLEQYRERAAKVAGDFYDSVLREINQTISTVANDVLTSLHKNNRLVSSSSEQLRGLLTKLAEYRDFISDQTQADELDKQIQLLHNVVPAVKTASSQKKRSGKSTGASEAVILDFAPLRRVLKDMQHDADKTLLELENTVSRFEDTPLIGSDTVPTNLRLIDFPVSRGEFAEIAGGGITTIIADTAHRGNNSDF